MTTQTKKCHVRMSHWTSASLKSGWTIEVRDAGYKRVLILELKEKDFTDLMSAQITDEVDGVVYVEG